MDLQPCHSALPQVTRSPSSQQTLAKQQWAAPEHTRTESDFNNSFGSWRSSIMATPRSLRSCLMAGALNSQGDLWKHLVKPHAAIWSVPGAPMSALSPTAMLEDAEVSYGQTSVSDIHPFPSISIFGKTFHLDLDLFGHVKCWEIKRKNHSEARRFLMLSGTFLCCLAGDFMRFQRSDQELTSLYATLFVVYLIYTYYFPYQSALAAGTKCTKRHKLCLSLLLFLAGSPLFVDWIFPR